MSRSYHETRGDLKGKSKKEIAEMAKDPGFILHKLAEKSMVKKQIVKKRKQLTKSESSC